MIAIITGDIINSRKENPEIWLPLLHKALNKYGRREKEWKIYRGDSFQLETSIENVFEAIFYLKACMRTNRRLDVRMAVGIGEKSFVGDDVTSSNGDAYIRSGELMDKLKRHNIALKSGWDDLDEQLNLILELAVSIAETWNCNHSKTVEVALENKTLIQTELALKLNKNQGQLSRELRKARFEEIQKTIDYCTKILLVRC